MKRVESKGNWSLMCPNECPGLSDTYGDEFEMLYEGYEKEGKFRRQVPAHKLWAAILDSQIETGTPYILYKDSCNRKSNQKVYYAYVIFGRSVLFKGKYFKAIGEGVRVKNIMSGSYERSLCLGKDAFYRMSK